MSASDTGCLGVRLPDVGQQRAVDRFRLGLTSAGQQRAIGLHQAGMNSKALVRARHAVTLTNRKRSSQCTVHAIGVCLLKDLGHLGPFHEGLLILRHHIVRATAINTKRSKRLYICMGTIGSFGTNVAGKIEAFCPAMESALLFAFVVRH